MSIFLEKKNNLIIKILSLEPFKMFFRLRVQLSSTVPIDFTCLAQIYQEKTKETLILIVFLLELNKQN